jgi:hypothetical protein
LGFEIIIRHPRKYAAQCTSDGFELMASVETANVEQIFIIKGVVFVEKKSRLT